MKLVPQQKHLHLKKTWNWCHRKNVEVGPVWQQRHLVATQGTSSVLYSSPPVGMPPDPKNGEVPGGDGAFRGPKMIFNKKTGAKRWSPGWIQWFLFATKQTYPRCCNVSGQMIIFHQPRLSICWGGSPTTLLFGVRSCEVAIIWVDVWIICLHERWTMVTCKEKWLVNIPVSWILWDMMV